MGFFPLKPKEFVLESCKTYYSLGDFKWLWLALNGSDVIHRLVILPFSRGGDLFSFLLYYVIRPELKYIAICLCNNDPDFIFLLNWLVVYSMPTAMSFVIGNRTMYLFHLLKEDFKNLLFDSLIMGKSWRNLSYLSSCALSQRRFQKICLNILRGTESLNQILLAQKYQGSSPNAFYGLEAYDTH